jgi:dual specificity phosphatase 12
MISDHAQEWAGFEHMVVRAMDKDGQDLLSFFPIVHGFIAEGRASGGAVLVHCMAGISRSATCLVSYIMHAEGLSLDDALTLVQGKR